MVGVELVKRFAHCGAVRQDILCGASAHGPACEYAKRNRNHIIILKMFWYLGTPMRPGSRRAQNPPFSIRLYGRTGIVLGLVDEQAKDGLCTHS